MISTISLVSDGQLISGIQFDLAWDDSLDIALAPAAQVGISSKVLYTRSPQSHVLRCVIVGVNPIAFTDGDLLRVFVSVHSTAPERGARVNLENLSATTSAGVSIPLQSNSADIQIQHGPTTPLIQPQSVLNSASLLPAAVSPGEIITLFGSISSSAPVLRFNGVMAPVIFSNSSQVNAIVPFGLDRSAPVTLELRQDESRTQVVLSPSTADPAIFTLASGGTGQGAILNQDFSVNSPSNPAGPGSIIMVYGTGFGTLNPPAVDGQQATVAKTDATVTATIGGLPAEVTYAGAAPDLISGMTQINIRVPAELPSLPWAPILLSTGSASSQAGVTVSIQ